MTVELGTRIEWWRPLVQWVLCLPHLVVAGASQLAQLPAFVVAGVVVAVTGRVPAWVGPFHARVLRHRASTFAYLFVLRTTSPPFTGDDADLARPLPPFTPRAPRRSSVVRPLVVLPHVLVLLPVGVVLDLCYPVWMVGVAVNRGWPPAIARSILAVEAWVVAIIAYVTMATDERPAFGLSAYGPTVTAWQSTTTGGARAT